MSSLNSASEILAPAQLESGAKKQNVIDTAKYFKRYVFEGDPHTLPEKNYGDQHVRNSR